jgi:outer membrane protein assembly factor BamB
MHLPKSNRGTWMFAGVAVVVAIIVAGIAIYELGKPSNTSNPHAAFVAPTTTNSTPKVAVHVNNFSWPFYGGGATRTRDFTGRSNLHPPFRTAWKFGGNALLEFPATIHGNNLYLFDGGATAKRVNIATGKQIWLRHVGQRSASTPALDPAHKLMFVTVLSTASASIDSFDGEIAAISMTSGRIAWTKPVPSGTESSPVVVGNSVYFGDQGGTLYSLNVLTGHENWSLQTSGPIKAGPAYYGGNLYFGNYSGSFYAVNARSGHELWSQSPGGEFYSTPAIAFGRVYVGNNDGHAYSFVLSNGTEAWATGLGNYVYSGPAVADTPGLGYTVYIGSYDGDLYALNAQTGAIRWSVNVGDSISGSATVVNNVVYVSTVYHPGSYGFNAKTGAKVFSFPDGSYTTVIANPGALFLMGRYVLYKLVPK